MTIYGPGIGTIWRTIEAYGHDPRRVIGESEYRPGRGGAGNVWLPYETLAAIRSRAIELIADPAVGLRSADALHPSHMGPLGYAWLASSTLLEGFRRLQRYGRMFNEHERLLVDEAPEQITLTIELPAQTRHIDEVRDSIMAGLVALCRMNYGRDLNPDLVRLRRQPPDEPGPWFGFFCCPVEFSRDSDQMVLSTRKARQLLSGADPQLVAMHDEAIERYLGHLDRSNIVARAKTAIFDCLPSGKVSEANVASALSMATRTLHRKLRGKGVSFRQMVVEVRKELARRYLQDESLSLTEIAFMLGYSDASAFSRACRKWFGRPPSAMRAA
jgi:AraC-like DNA-binding protein